MPEQPVDRQPLGTPASLPSRRRGALTLLLLSGAALVLAMSLALAPSETPAPRGRPVPDFDLPPVEGRVQGFSSSDLKGEISLVNVFASWCIPCRQEHPILLALQSEGLVPIYGLNHRDRPEDAAPWLKELGDPYTRTGADVDGRVGAAWGIYGVPQTFVIDRDGRIAYTHLGPVTQAIVDAKLRPMVLELRGAAGR